MDYGQDGLGITAFVHDKLPVHIERFDIPVVGDRLERDVGHANLFALVDVRRALLHVQEGGEQLGRLDPIATVIAEP